MKIEKCPFCGKQIAEIGNCKNMEECEHFEGMSGGRALCLCGLQYQQRRLRRKHGLSGGCRKSHRRVEPPRRRCACGAWGVGSMQRFRRR